MVTLRIYDFFARHRKLLALALAALTAVLGLLVLNLRFSEEITDFLPIGTDDREALSVYQNISGANGLYILFSNPGNPDRTVEAIDRFEELINEKDTGGWCSSLVCRFDMENIEEVSDFVYANIPYFLEPEDYARMDSLLASPSWIPERIARDREMLRHPDGGVVSSNLRRDPLGLFGPVLSSIRTSDNRMSFEMYGGHIFTPDMSRAVAMMDSPFGSSETEYNARLMELLDDAAAEVNAVYPDVRVSVVGGPAVAVGNARRIKTDSVIAISLSVILIILLLARTFNSVRNIILIFISIAWGMLFALGGVSIFKDSVSIIVIGISSVILGIAVNYPLHLIAHTSHQSDRRLALSEVLSPLVVGNITTIGAFLALIPLKANALHDLGIFASLLLAGTILFVLVCLPHFIKVEKTAGKGRHSKALEFLSGLNPEKCRPLVIAVVAVTLILAFFSFSTGFDTNLSHINYLSDEQRSELLYFDDLLTGDEDHTLESVYVLSSGENYEAALERNVELDSVIDSLQLIGKVKARQGVSHFIVSRDEQIRRLARWNSFVDRHNEDFNEVLPAAAASCGFKKGAFSAFYGLIEDFRDAEPKDPEYFSTLTESVFRQNFTALDDTGLSYVVDVLNVEPGDIAEVESCFPQSFDVAGMNSALSNTLSDNFNYIGWACSLIVFFFLWFSFGSFELALISFLPMAISWLWILGLMALLGIKFNIVNVILATFIFGQGDDYTIFMTEGCQYEYKFRRPILASYKSSIIQSALIMFVGIGTLIFARHPAMKSLAQVTIIGMFSVVLMAYIIPPYLFGWLTSSKGVRRRFPITLGRLLKGVPTEPEEQVRLRYAYKGKDTVSAVRSSLRRRSDEVKSMDLSGKESFEWKEEGYGELSILLALTHPGVKVTALCRDEEKMLIASISADGFVDNLEFKLDN